MHTIHYKIEIDIKHFQNARSSLILIGNFEFSKMQDDSAHHNFNGCQNLVSHLISSMGQEIYSIAFLSKIIKNSK